MDERTVIRPQCRLQNAYFFSHEYTLLLKYRNSLHKFIQSAIVKNVESVYLYQSVFAQLFPTSKAAYGSLKCRHFLALIADDYLKGTGENKTSVGPQPTRTKFIILDNLHYIVGGKGSREKQLVWRRLYYVHWTYFLLFQFILKYNYLDRVICTERRLQY